MAAMVLSGKHWFSLDNKAPNVTFKYFVILLFGKNVKCPLFIWHKYQLANNKQGDPDMTHVDTEFLGWSRRTGGDMEVVKPWAKRLRRWLAGANDTACNGTVRATDADTRQGLLNRL